MTRVREVDSFGHTLHRGLPCKVYKIPGGAGTTVGNQALESRVDQSGICSQSRLTGLCTIHAEVLLVDVAICWWGRSWGCWKPYVDHGTTLENKKCTEKIVVYGERKTVERSWLPGG